METGIPIGDIPSIGIPVLLTIALNLLAEALKKATGEKINRWLPLLLMVAGAIAYPFLADATSLTVNVANPKVYLIVVGLCIGGMSVGVNQVVKQFTGKEEKK